MKELLIKKGVKILCPESVEIGDEVNPEKISQKAIIHTGTKIYGKDTFIADDVEIGKKGQATLINCQVGKNCKLEGGFFEEAVFVQDNICEAATHIRAGTIFEEFSKVAHCVGLKQTILFPFVTFGSLINFCDAMITGGTSQKDHSEIGSSYIHFNYTPNQDKATPSIFGDVPNGVMLRKAPIFLGGQGGAVGPIHINFGCIAAAGTILKKSEENENHIIYGNGFPTPYRSIPFNKRHYQNTNKIVLLNLFYIENLLALRIWYQVVRKKFISKDFPKELHDGLMKNVNLIIKERCDKLEAFLINAKEQKSKWADIEKSINESSCYVGDPSLMEKFLEILEKRQIKNNYIKSIKTLEADECAIGTAWLKSIFKKNNTL